MMRRMITAKTPSVAGIGAEAIRTMLAQLDLEAGRVVEA